MNNMDTIRNQIGSYVNNMLATDKATPWEMRYILKAILGEVAEMELTQNYIVQAQAQAENQKHEMAHEAADNEG